MYKLCL